MWQSRGLSSSDEVPAQASIDDYCPDDTDIPLSEVISDTVGLDLSTFIELEVNRGYDFITAIVTKLQIVSWLPAERKTRGRGYLGLR